MSAPNPVLAWAAKSTIAHVGFAFLAMGGWAVFANWEHGASAALRAGLVQGGLSAAITLCLKKAVEALHRRFAGRAALILPPLIACSVSLMVLIGAHVAAGTPEIARTIAVPFSVAFSYACIYNFGLWRAGRQAG